MGIQDYQINYDIQVQAKGVKELTSLAAAVDKLKFSENQARNSVAALQGMMDKMDAIFRPKGKKRDINYKIDVDTKKTEEKLLRISSLLDEIKTKSQGIKVVINAGEKLDSKSIKAQAQAVINSQIVEQSKKVGNQGKKNVKDTINSLTEPINRINQLIGKVNAALVSLQTGREINIKTDVAKERLQEILSLMTQIKGASKMTLGMGMGSPQKVSQTQSQSSGSTKIVPVSLMTGNNVKSNISPELTHEQYKIFDKALREQEKEHKRNVKAKLDAFRKRGIEEQKRADLFEQARVRDALRNDKINEKIERDALREQEREHKRNVKAKLDAFRKRGIEEQKRSELFEWARVRDSLNKDKKIEVAQKALLRRGVLENQVNENRQRAAINRLQYAKAPSWRNMPFAGMVSGYMAYGLIKSELGAAVDYANIMESARSILKVADSNLSTFEERFDKMSRNVRQIGIDTKFTAQEIAGATKFLAMAGMSIETINAAMRPITNLALIGDNDVAQIADLTTNIMSGYDIKNTSMNPVADIIASTISRSNVNVVEMAESYKMAAGYLKMSGVDFAESSAAIGILGNSGIKGTMAGTALRAMSTRFAKPTKEAQDTLNRLGIKFTEFHNVYGKQVEKLRSLADIFEELNQKGATMGDMQAIFGKIGGNAAMMFVDNYAELRTLSNQNRASHGISTELAEVKQNTTKGLWAQMTSTFSESFMQAYELVEPIIKTTLKDLLSKFKPREFAQGIATIGRMLLDVFSALGKIGAWVTRNFHWIEPLVFTGFVATKIFKLAGALTNLGVALGFIGKQAGISKVLSSIGGLAGIGGNVASTAAMSFANKRALITALQTSGAMGVGKGAASKALAQIMQNSGTGSVAKQTISGLFSSQVSTGSGLIGAGSSIAAIGSGAVAATAGVSALVAALGYVAYKAWKVKEAKDAVQEDIQANRKYRYPSIDALREALSDTYQQALSTKKAVDDVTTGKTLSESSGQAAGKLSFTSNWFSAVLDNLIPAEYGTQALGIHKDYTIADAYQDDIKAAIQTEAKRDSQLRVESAFAELGKLKTTTEVNAFIRNVKSKYGQDEDSLDYSLWDFDNKTKTYKYIDGLDKMPASIAAKTFEYFKYQNNVTVPEIIRNAQAFRDAISSPESALSFLSNKTKSGKKTLDIEDLNKHGFYQNDKGEWVQKLLGKNATEKDREDALTNYQYVRNKLINLNSSLRKVFGDSSDAADTILKMAGFKPYLYANDPDYNDTDPWNKNGIAYTGGDDGGAGGNYSGTGKLSSAAPKQVIVNITNLLSVQTIELMKTPEGKSPEIQDLKDMMAQALIDVVHDFDASWNG